MSKIYSWKKKQNLIDQKEKKKKEKVTQMLDNERVGAVFWREVG